MVKHHEDGGILMCVFLFSPPQSSQLTDGAWHVSVESEPVLGHAAGDISVVQDGVQTLQELPCQGVCVCVCVCERERERERVRVKCSSLSVRVSKSNL